MYNHQTPYGDLVFHSNRGTGFVDLYLVKMSPGFDASADRQSNIGTGENPDWLGTDKMVYFSAKDGSGIWVADVSGANRRLVYPYLGSLAPAGAPDGDSIAVSLSTGGAGWNIYRFSASAGQSSQQQLTTGNFHDWLPAWSPDGNYMAFVSDRDAVNETWAVWIIAADQQNPQPICLFELPGPPQGAVLHAQNLSHGWGEERISWGP